MSVQLALNKPSKSILIDWINASNEAQLTENQVTFEKLAVRKYQKRDHYDFNSEMRLKAVWGKGYYGERTVKYDRLDLAKVVGHSRIALQSDYTDLDTALAGLNHDFGLGLSKDEIYLDRVDDETGKVTIQIRQSPLYLPESKVVVAIDPVLELAIEFGPRLWEFSTVSFKEFTDKFIPGVPTFDYQKQ